MKRCPNCGKYVQDDALKCKYCWGELNASSKIIEEANLGKSIIKYGTLKKIYIHEFGFRIRGINKNIQYLWTDVDYIEYVWSKTTINVLAYNHDFSLKFVMKQENLTFTEEWNPGSIYIDISDYKIKKLLSSIAGLGIEIR